MLENMSAGTAEQPRRMSRSRRRVRLPTDAHERRIEQLRRAYQRALGRKATLIEKAAMLRAALLTARAEAAALDATATLDDVVRLDRAAAAARARLSDLVGGFKRHKPVAVSSGPSLPDLMARHRT